ncbi:hypothetical protein B0H14DRAFT_3133043 [Mycena olivaceomarginata]|nr:hypothetical protein B0H14DRAFT_3133043 [Mycena olivaceomarginata]
MKFAAFLLAACSALAAASAETVTLYGFRPAGYPPAAVSLSAGGVGADGATTYVEAIVQTAIAYADATTTRTGGALQTLHATLIADASIYRYSLLPPASATGLANNDAFPVNVLETCTLDGHGGGACVAQAWADGGPTATTTFTGPVAPFYTLTVGADGGGANKNGSGKARVPTREPKPKPLTSRGTVCTGVAWLDEPRLWLDGVTSSSQASGPLVVERYIARSCRGVLFLYIVLSLFFDKVTVHLPSHTKPLTITAKGATSAKYVHGLTIDGQTAGSPVIRHEQIAAQMCGLR